LADGCSLIIIAVVASIFVEQEEKIEQLEKRVKELEEKG
jgi:hypothetical protein